MAQVNQFYICHILCSDHFVIFVFKGYAGKYCNIVIHIDFGLLHDKKAICGWSAD